jgi:hypothetical protein
LSTGTGRSVSTLSATPLSGASRFRGSGHDVDIYAFGPDEAPLATEVKKRKGGTGLAETLFNLQHIEGFDERVDQMRIGRSRRCSRLVAQNNGAERI